MARYILTSDYTATTHNEGANAVQQTKLFKKGDIVDGSIVEIGFVSVVVGGATFFIPIAVVNEYTGSNPVNTTIVINEPQPLQSVQKDYSTKNIIITVVVILAAIGLLKLFKII